MRVNQAIDQLRVIVSARKKFNSLSNLRSMGYRRYLDGAEKRCRFIFTQAKEDSSSK